MCTLKNMILFVLVITVSPLVGQISADSVAAYVESIQKQRQGKNIKLMYGEGTPLTPEQHKVFKGLHYFGPDINYRVTATLEKSEKPAIVEMRTSTERAPEYIEYGTVQFEFEDNQYSLKVYQSKKMQDANPNDSTLFIPFRDETSGDETYGGGRYVDCLLPASGNTLILDFNTAYNPYCAYNPRFSCVIPPEENRLPIAIKAGEKIYEKH